MGDPRSVPEIGAAELFIRALAQLDEFPEAEPDTPHRTLIGNVRLANRAGDAVILESRAEVQSVIADRPELQRAAHAFVDAHR